MQLARCLFSYFIDLSPKEKAIDVEHIIMTSHERQDEDLRSQSSQRYARNSSELTSSGHESSAVHPSQLLLQKQAPQRRQPPPNGASISIAVDPVALITTECITVTSAMRKHSRWAQSSVSAILGGGPHGREVGRPVRQNDKGLSPSQLQGRPGRTTNGLPRDDDTLANRWGLRGKKGKSIQDNPLMSAFAHLRNDLRGCTG